MTTDQRTGTGRFGAATVGFPPPQIELPPEEAAKRRRRWPWVVAVLAILALLPGAFLVGNRLGSRGQVEVGQVRRDIPAGGSVQPSDLVAVRVLKKAATTGAATNRPLVGTVARDTLRAGSLLPANLLANGLPLPGPDDVLLGIAADPGAVPDGLAAGDRVTVLRLPLTTAAGSQQPNLDSPRSQAAERHRGVLSRATGFWNGGDARGPGVLGDRPHRAQRAAPGGADPNPLTSGRAV